MQNEGDKNGCKYIFVCGLHRSGTSLLARNIGRLENCTGFESEGQNLQDIYPLESEYGGPGRFGFNRRAHLTETSGLLTSENVARLRSSWHSYWDKSKTICVEKTPGNLVMTRFLHAVFPNSYFIVLRRHPVAVSMATQRMWVVRLTSMHSLFEHWLHCHELFDEDKKYLKHVYELAYEDYVENPDKYHQEIAAFIGTRVPEDAMKEVGRAHSKKYFDRWCDLLTKSFFKSYYRYIAEKYEPRFAKYGYSLTKRFGTGEEVRRGGGGKISAAVGILLCVGAGAYAFLQRSWRWAPWYIKQQIKAVLPAFVLRRIGKTRHQASLGKGKAGVASP